MRGIDGFVSPCVEGGSGVHQGDLSTSCSRNKKFKK